MAVQLKIINGQKVIGLFDDLSNGSIFNLADIEKRVEIAKKLMDVLDIKIIAEKTGLSEEKIKNL